MVFSGSQQRNLGGDSVSGLPDRVLEKEEDEGIKHYEEFNNRETIKINLIFCDTVVHRTVISAILQPGGYPYCR